MMKTNIDEYLTKENIYDEKIESKSLKKIYGLIRRS